METPGFTLIRQLSRYIGTPMLHAHWPEQCLRAFGLCISGGWSIANFTQSLGLTTEGKEILLTGNSEPRRQCPWCWSLVVWGGVGKYAGPEASQQKHQGEEPRRHPPSVVKAAGHTAGASQFPGFLSGDLESQSVYTFCR